MLLHGGAHVIDADGGGDGYGEVGDTTDDANASGVRLLVMTLKVRRRCRRCSVLLPLYDIGQVVDGLVLASGIDNSSILLTCVYISYF